MKYYYYRPDSDRFNAIGLKPEDRNLISIRTVYARILPTWKPIEVVEFDDNPGVEGDFPSLTNYNQLPVMSHKAWQALEPVIGSCCEPLPLRHPSGSSLYLVHFTESTDALDVEKSELKRYTDGGIMRVVRYALKSETIRGRHAVKLPKESGGEVLVDEEFRKAVEANKLLGLEFKEVSMV